MSYILGLSCGFHDSAVSLISNGKVLAAVEEESFTGIKHDSSFPHNSINWIFSEYGITNNDLEAICFYESPELKLDRISESTKRGGLSNTVLRNKIISRNKKQYKELQKEFDKLKGDNTKLYFVDHHESHAAYSYYTSPFDRASILCVDGVGEWETTTMFFGEGNKLTKSHTVHFPHSLGMIYSAFTAFLGFKPNEGEYKVMGLAPYGDHRKYKEKFKELYTPLSNGKFEFDMDYFTYDWDDKTMFNEKLGELFGLPNRLPDEELTQDHKDLAATLQNQYEYLFFRLLDTIHAKDKSNNLCLGGGSAYNGTANGKILELTDFTRLWIPPAPSDAGSAIGCALHYYYNQNEDVDRVENTNPYLGPDYSDNQIRAALNEYKDSVVYVEKPDSFLFPLIAKQIESGMVIGWFEGRKEFGARALGNRSILANPCDPEMKAKVNRIIKKREGFRPFAPMVRYKDQSKYFSYKSKVPYMNQVVEVKYNLQKRLPSITHIDGSARIQSLTEKDHKRMYRLLGEMEKLTGYPILINTSFNLKDQTMVLDPRTAIQTFLNCEMDTLVMNNFIIKKKVK